MLVWFLVAAVYNLLICVIVDLSSISSKAFDVLGLAWPASPGNWARRWESMKLVQSLPPFCWRACVVGSGSHSYVDVCPVNCILLVHEYTHGAPGVSEIEMHNAQGQCFNVYSLVFEEGLITTGEPNCVDPSTLTADRPRATSSAL